MNTFVTHPSIRIKGTENVYNVQECFSTHCSFKYPHMHCPFCIKTEAYTDPVILRAHYRVKHVDKGLDFAGLKILRCCESCNIKGAIKGEKKFKGAHWHCYKCNNGFNRRDEALKHFKTHFRNPQTTFQIQVAQEVNSMSSVNLTDSPMLSESEVATEEISVTTDDHDMMSISANTIHPVLAEAVMSTAATDTGLLTSSSDGLEVTSEVREDKQVAANEIVDTDQQQTIMIIQEDGTLGDISSLTGTELTTINSQTLDVGQLLLTKNDLERKVSSLKSHVEQLELEKSQREQQLQAEIEQLKSQMELQSQEIATLQQKEQSFIEQLSIPLDEKIQSLLEEMQTRHTDLLHQQLGEVKRLYCERLGKEIPLTTTSATSTDGDNINNAITSSDNIKPDIDDTETTTYTVMYDTDTLSVDIQADPDSDPDALDDQDNGSIQTEDLVEESKEFEDEKLVLVTTSRLKRKLNRSSSGSSPGMKKKS